MDQDFFDKIMQDGHDCPCCGRYAKVYKRTLHSSVALQLIRLHKLGGYWGHYVHASRMILSKQSGAGDFTKAKMWKLIEPFGPTSDKTKASGLWQLTALGKDFVEGKVAIQRIALVYDDKVVGYRGGVVYINDCLGSAFNYSELMDA